MRTLPIASIDAVICDPPYAATGAASSYVAKGKARTIPREYQFYESWLREHLVEMRRVLRDTGAIWMTIDWRGAMALDRACASLGMAEPKIGVWDRGGLGMGNVLRNCYECFAVVPMPKFQRTTASEPDVWRHPWGPGNRRHGHSAEKPVPLMARAVRLVTRKGGVVLDPFTGSGSTGVGAIAEGRRFIGVEREADFAELARERIAAAASQRSLLETGT